MWASSQGFFNHQFIKAVESHDKQGFIEDVRRRLAKRNPQSEAEDYETVLAYAESNSLCRQWVMDPSLESAWHECLEDFLLPLDGGKNFSPIPQFSIPAYQQVHANLRFYETALEMKAINTDAPHHAMTEEIRVNLQKASASGSFQATYLLHRYALERVMAAQHQQEIENNVSKLLPIVDNNILSMHGTPAFLLLAETYFVLSLKLTDFGKKIRKDIQIEVLKLLQLAQKLEFYSVDAIHNAYLGNDLPTAFKLNLAMARATPIEFHHWSQFQEELSVVLFPDLGATQMALTVTQHQSNAEKICNSFISNWEAHHLITECLDAKV